MSNTRLKEYLRQIIVAVGGRKKCLVTLLFLLSLETATTNWYKKWHFHSYHMGEEQQSFHKLCVGRSAIIKRCNEVWTTLSQGNVARIQHKLCGFYIITEKYTVFSSTIIWLDKQGMTSFYFIVITGADSKTSLQLYKNWHLNPMHSAEPRLIIFKSKHHRDWDRQLVTGSVAAQPDAQLRQVSTDRGRLKLSRFSVTSKAGSCNCQILVTHSDKNIWGPQLYTCSQSSSWEGAQKSSLEPSTAKQLFAHHLICHVIYMQHILIEIHFNIFFHTYFQSIVSDYASSNQPESPLIITLRNPTAESRI